jgi:RNA ligase (TIGR02306 family)
MSTFKVEKRKVATSVIHPNADKLSLCTVEGLGYQFVTGRDQFKVGDEVSLFPLDAELPPALVEALGMVGKFSGPEKNRISTVKLRGQFSQGFICPIEVICKYLGNEDIEITSNMDLTSSLGVTKYEAEPILCKTGNLIQLPPNVPIYDIEGVDRNQHIVDHIINNKIKVAITEKVEGTNYSCTVFKDGTVSVNQRRNAIQEIPEKGEHDFWRYTREYGIIDLVKKIQTDTNAEEVTVRGELLGPGIQKNVYKFKKHTLKFFDVMVNGTYVNVDVFFDYFRKFNCPDYLVPLLAYDVYLDDWLAGRTVQEAAGGKSALGFDYREGIVIKPMVEQQHSDIGRLIIKHRDREYLAVTGL